VTSSYVSLRMPEDLLEDARLRAEAEDRSLSAVVRLAVRQYIADSRPKERTVKPTAARSTASDRHGKRTSASSTGVRAA